MSELWSRNPQCEVANQTRSDKQRESVRLIWTNRDAPVTWPWSIHDLLPLDTGNGRLITIYQRTTIETDNKRGGLWHRRSRGHAHGMWCALSFTITKSAVTNASCLYTTRCFCAVAVNFPKIFRLVRASPDLRTKHSGAITFNSCTEHPEAFDRRGFTHIIAGFCFKNDSLSTWQVELLSSNRFIFKRDVYLVGHFVLIDISSISGSEETLLVG